MANDAATKAYVLALGKGLHTEFGRRGVSLSVLLPGATNTPVLERFGVQPGSSPVKPMTVEQCVAEGLNALSATAPRRSPAASTGSSTGSFRGRAVSMMMGRMAW